MTVQVLVEVQLMVTYELSKRTEQNKAILKALDGLAGTDNSADNERNAVATINETIELTKRCESDIKKLKSDCKKKRKRHPNDSTKIRKINNKYEKKIDYQKAIIKSLKKSIVQQTRKLDIISEKNKNEEDDSLVDSSTSSDSDSDNSTYDDNVGNSSSKDSDDE